MFEVTLEQFAGPLQLLLGFIEEKKLPITEVSLAAVTEPYLRYLESHDVPTSELADFLLVASRLLLLKSSELLPQPLEEEEEAPSKLAAQLRLYQIFWEAAKGLQHVWTHPRPMLLPAHHHLPVRRAEGFSPNLQAKVLEQSFEHLLKYLQPFFSLGRVSLERVRSVSERVEEIREALSTRARLSFADLRKRASSRVDVVMQFLALLELLKQKHITTKQQKTFGDIMIERSS